jgi:hypothetical protein
MVDRIRVSRSSWNGRRGGGPVCIHLANVLEVVSVKHFIVVYLLNLADRTARFDEMYLAHSDWDYNTPLRTIELIGSVKLPGICFVT